MAWFGSSNLSLVIRQCFHKYAHDYEGNFVRQQFLPDEAQGQQFWVAQDNPQEAKLKERMDKLWKEETET